ncbi:MAG: TrkH family potassium uptake protein [Candidatus Thermoplasmatota archaeon]|nr:TrkH family potassium uptake protein [Candidatus Thermoplasmatota archaeon]
MLARLAFRVKALLDALGLVIMLFSLVFLLPVFVAFYYSEAIHSVMRSYVVPMILTANIGLLLWVLGIEEAEMIRDRKLIFAILLGWIVLMLIPSSVILPLKIEYFPALIFAVIAIICIVVFIILKYFRRARLKELREREAFVCVALGWLIISAFAAMPYTFSNSLGYVDSYFEAMSGFATCGSTVLEVPKGLDYLNVYPHSLMFWRALTQWLGGMGIIVLSIVVLARAMGPGGARLFKAEVSGKEVTRLKPRIKETASALWKVYLLFTIIGIILLFLATNDVYDSVCHSFTSLSTGGFSTRYQNIAAYDNVFVEIIIIGLMIVGGTNFILHYRLLSGKPKALFTDPGFKFYISSIIIAIVLITINLILSASSRSPLDTFRIGVFQAVSINTTTGFSSANFAQWPFASQLILLVLMFIGGCAGSSAGGIKTIRTLVLLKVVKRELRRIIHPKAVEPITLAKHPIEEGLVHNIIAFFFLYILIFIVSAIGVALIENLDIVSSASAVATTMGTVGPGLGKVGPATTFASLLPITKLWLTACMWLGRLEIFACLVLFMPRTYRG